MKPPRIPAFNLATALSLGLLLPVVAGPAHAEASAIDQGLINKVASYYDTNKNRSDRKYGCNWYRVLIAFEVNELPEWKGPDGYCSNTAYTAEEARKSEKIWKGWKPIRQTLEDIETQTVYAGPAHAEASVIDQDLISKVVSYYDTNKNRSDRKYGCNWYRVLIAFEVNELPEWKGPDGYCSNTAYTAEEARKSEKIWKGWKPIRQALEDIETQTIYVPAKSQRSDAQSSTVNPKLTLELSQTKISEGNSSGWRNYKEVMIRVRLDKDVQNPINFALNFSPSSGFDRHNNINCATNFQNSNKDFCIFYSFKESSGNTVYQFGRSGNITGSIKKKGIIVHDNNRRETAYVIRIKGNTIADSDHTVGITLSTSTSNVTLMNASQTLTITNDDFPRPDISLKSDSRVYEGGTTTFTISTPTNVTSDMRIAYVFTDGGANFLGSSDDGAYNRDNKWLSAVRNAQNRKFVTIPKGQKSVDVSVTTVNDTTEEPNGEVRAYIVNQDHYSPADGDEATYASVYIHDSDRTITATLVMNDDIQEGNSGTTATTHKLVLSEFVLGSVSFCSTATIDGFEARDKAHPKFDGRWPNWDYDRDDNSSCHTISPQTTEKSFTMGVRGDDIFERNEKIDIEISWHNNQNPYNLQIVPDSTPTKILNDDDAPELTIATVSTPVDEGDTASFSITANRKAQWPYDILLESTDDETSNFIDDGQLTVRMPAYATSLTFDMQTKIDKNEDEDGTISVNFDPQGTASGEYSYTGSAASVAVGNVTVPTVSVESSASSIKEGDSITFTFAVDQAPDAALSISYNLADHASDFVDAADEGDQTIELTPGNTSVSLTITTTGDATLEDDGNIILSLSDDVTYHLNADKSNVKTFVLDDDRKIAGSTDNYCKLHDSDPGKTRRIRQLCTTSKWFFEREGLKKAAKDGIFYGKTLTQSKQEYIQRVWNMIAMNSDGTRIYSGKADITSDNIRSNYYNHSASWSGEELTKLYRYARSTLFYIETGGRLIMGNYNEFNAKQCVEDFNHPPASALSCGVGGHRVMIWAPEEVIEGEPLGIYLYPSNSLNQNVTVQMTYTNREGIEIVSGPISVPPEGVKVTSIKAPNDDWDNRDYISNFRFQVLAGSNWTINQDDTRKKIKIIDDEPTLMEWKTNTLTNTPDEGGFQRIAKFSLYKPRRGDGYNTEALGNDFWEASDIMIWDFGFTGNINLQNAKPVSCLNAEDKDACELQHASNIIPVWVNLSPQSTKIDLDRFRVTGKTNDR